MTKQNKQERKNLHLNFLFMYKNHLREMMLPVVMMWQDQFTVNTYYQLHNVIQWEPAGITELNPWIIFWIIGKLFAVLLMGS